MAVRPAYLRPLRHEGGAPSHEEGSSAERDAAAEFHLIVLVRAREGHNPLPEDGHVAGMWAVRVNPSTQATTEQWQCRAALSAFWRCSDIAEPEGFELFVLDPNQNLSALKPGLPDIHQWGLVYPSEVIGRIDAPEHKVQTFLASLQNADGSLTELGTVTVAGESHITIRGRGASQCLALMEERLLDHPEALFCDTRLDAIDLDPQLVCPAAEVHVEAPTAPRAIARMCQ